MKIFNKDLKEIIEIVYFIIGRILLLGIIICWVTVWVNKYNLSTNTTIQTETKKLNYNPQKDSLIYNFINSNITCTEINRFKTATFLKVNNGVIAVFLVIKKEIPFEQSSEVRYYLQEKTGVLISCNPNDMAIEYRCSQIANDSLINFLVTKYKL